MEIKAIFTNNLKFYRQQMKLTQKEVAEKLNVAREQYSRYEVGKLELDYYKLVQVCKILDITPNDLFEGCFND